MSGTTYNFKGTFQAEENSFVSMYGGLKDESWVLDEKLITFNRIKENIYSFQVELDDKEEAIRVLSFINWFGRMIEYTGYEYDGENMRKSHIYKFSNGIQTVYEEQLRQEYQEDADFNLFKELFLSVDEKTSSFQSSLDSEEQTIKQLKVILQKTSDKEQLLEELVNSLGTEQITEKLSIEVKSEYAQNFIEEKVNLAIYVFKGTINLFVDYMLGEFKPTDTKLVFLPINDTEDDSVNVQLKIFEGHTLTGTLPKLIAEDFFLDDETTILMELDQEWINPCDVCINCLKRQVTGCKICSFEHINTFLKHIS